MHVRWRQKWGLSGPKGFNKQGLAAHTKKAQNGAQELYKHYIILPLNS